MQGIHTRKGENDYALRVEANREGDTQDSPNVKKDRMKMSLVKAMNEEYQKKSDRKDKDKRDQK